MTKEHLQEAVEEVRKDFEKSLEKINFKGYAPCSYEFRAAINIGKMWRLLSCLAEQSDGIAEEIEGAKKYARSYELTKDVSYKQMAKDELKHAGILIQKAKAGMPGGANNETLKHYEEEIKAVNSHLDMAAVKGEA